MTENLKNTISDVLTEVLKNKYIVKVIDNIAEKFDVHEWNVSELITYLTANEIKEIHLHKHILETEFKIFTG